MHIWELEPLGFMARKFGDRLGPEVFLLDGAATAHMVDGAVVLFDEEEVNITIKGVAEAVAVAKGALVAGGSNSMEH